jgi:YbbR domain-containing protein
MRPRGSRLLEQTEMRSRFSFIGLPRHVGVLFFAVMLSVAVWVLANAEQNPEVTGVFSSPIPVEVSGLPKGMVIYGSGPGLANVKIRAPQASWGRLRVGSFRAYVDLSNSAAGLQEVEVNVECSDSRVRVLEKDPSRVAVRLEPVLKRSVPVRIRALDEAPVGFTMLPPKATPPQITITGPAPLAESVSEAYVEVRIDGSKVSFVKSYQPQLRDAQGKEVKDLEEAPATVDVEVPIEQLRNYKTVSIKAVITGTVAPGYWISGIVVQPAAITFGGDPQVLESFGYVETAPVDITGAVTEVLKSVGIYTPPGTALDKKQDVFVKVSVEPIPGGGVLRRTLTWRNLTRGITATLSLSTVDIRVDGPVPDLRSLKPTDMAPSVDLTGLLTGTYTLPVTVTGVPTGTKVISVDPEKVGVSIR